MKYVVGLVGEKFFPLGHLQPLAYFISYIWAKFVVLHPAWVKRSPVSDRLWMMNGSTVSKQSAVWAWSWFVCARIVQVRRNRTVTLFYLNVKLFSCCKVIRNAQCISAQVIAYLGRLQKHPRTAVSVHVYIFDWRGALMQIIPLALVVQAFFQGSLRHF